MKCSANISFNAPKTADVQNRNAEQWKSQLKVSWWHTCYRIMNDSCYWVNFVPRLDWGCDLALGGERRQLRYLPHALRQLLPWLQAAWRRLSAGLGSVLALLPHPLYREVAPLATAAAVPYVQTGLEVQQQVDKWYFHVSCFLLISLILTVNV